MNKNNNPFKKNNKKINNIKHINNNGNNKILVNQVYCLNSLKGVKNNNLPINNKLNLMQYQNEILANKKNEIIYNMNNKK